MSSYIKTIAQATAIVGYDLLTGERYAKENYPRVLTRVGLVGSAAAGDCNASILIGGIESSKVANTKTGLAPDNDDMVPILVPVPANAQLEIKMNVQPTTNALGVRVDLTP